MDFFEFKIQQGLETSHCYVNNRNAHALKVTKQISYLHRVHIFIVQNALEIQCQCSLLSNFMVARILYLWNYGGFVLYFIFKGKPSASWSESSLFDNSGSLNVGQHKICCIPLDWNESCINKNFFVWNHYSEHLVDQADGLLSFYKFLTLFLVFCTHYVTSSLENVHFEIYKHFSFNLSGGR